MSMVRTVRNVGEVVRAARVARGWSQQQAADAAGVSRRFVSMFEGGTHSRAEIGRVLALLDALGVRLTAVLPADEAAAPVEAPSLRVAPTVDEFDLNAYLQTFITSPTPQPAPSAAQHQDTNRADLVQDSE